jgi:hypothetical protein
MNSSIQKWLEHLQCLFPVTGVIHVGVGYGADLERYAHRDVQAAVLVEAEEWLCEKLSATLATRPGWSVHCAVLSATEAERDFYIASNPNESGLLRPENLTAMWRNLSTSRQSRVNATTLERLMSKSGQQSIPFNWIHVECLPSLPVIEGAGNYLDGIDVITARVIFDGDDSCGNGATKSALDKFLTIMGFRFLFFEQERQPAVGTALYVRDLRAFARPNLVAEMQKQIKQLDAEREKYDGTISALESQGQLLSKSNTEQAERLSQTQSELVQVMAERDGHAALAREMQEKAELLTREKQGQVSQVGELQSQLDKLGSECERNASLASTWQQLIEQLVSATNGPLFIADQGQVSDTSDSKKKASTLTALNDEQDALLRALQSKIEHLTIERDQQAINALELKQLVDQQANAYAALECELSSARQACSISLKIQALREADLRDLQVRYQDVLQKLDKQHQLLTKLAERLNIASNCIKQSAQNVQLPVLVPNEPGMPLSASSSGGPTGTVKATQ